eukprot:14910976-Ditylum_brightwellii.AAC.1
MADTQGVRTTNDACVCLRCEEAVLMVYWSIRTCPWVGSTHPCSEALGQLKMAGNCSWQMGFGGILLYILWIIS